MTSEGALEHNHVWEMSLGIQKATMYALLSTMLVLMISIPFASMFQDLQALLQCNSFNIID